MQTPEIQILLNRIDALERGLSVSLERLSQRVYDLEMMANKDRLKLYLLAGVVSAGSATGMVGILKHFVG